MIVTTVTSIVIRKYHSYQYSLFILILIITVPIVIGIISSVPSILAISYLEQVQANYDDYNNSLWSLGNDIQDGDYYSYTICNDDTIAQKIYPYHCYEISLEFVTILQSYQGKVWVVQGNLTTPDVSEQMIFLIDVYNFKVNTDILHKELGASLEKTIFSLSQYGEKSLSIGTIWSEMDSYFTNKIPLEIKNKQTIPVSHTSIVTSVNGTKVTTIVTNIETSVLSYDVIVPSNVYLHNDFPFPLKAKLYSPHIIYPEPQELYYFELLEYGNYDSNYHSRDYGTENNPTIPTENQK